jgi:glutamine synthetase
MPIAFELSLMSLENDTKLRELMGEHFIAAYIGIKRKEYETFFRVISSWEREYLLMNV